MSSDIFTSEFLLGFDELECDEIPVEANQIRNPTTGFRFLN